MNPSFFAAAPRVRHRPWLSTLLALQLVAVLWWSGPVQAAKAAQAAPKFPSTNVAWLAAAADADMERAFGQAKAQNKPVLL